MNKSADNTEDCPIEYRRRYSDDLVGRRQKWPLWAGGMALLVGIAAGGTFLIVAALG